MLMEVFEAALKAQGAASAGAAQPAGAASALVAAPQRGAPAGHPPLHPDVIAGFNGLLAGAKNMTDASADRLQRQQRSQQGHRWVPQPMAMSLLSNDPYFSTSKDMRKSRVLHFGYFAAAAALVLSTSRTELRKRVADGGKVRCCCRRPCVLLPQPC